MEEATGHKTHESETSENRVPEKPTGKPKTFKCPSCAGTIEIRAVGATINAVCKYCSSVIDVTDENYQVIDEAHKRVRETPLEIGNRGCLKGVIWEVVGYTEKTDSTGVYNWDEYLLYNPYYGFRFLVQYLGHWSFVKVLRQDVCGADLADELWLGDQKFAIFLRDESFVKYVKGEFYWRVKVGERTLVSDYIAPPYMLSVEKNGQEINVSLGEYVAPDEIADAFSVDLFVLPPKTGVASNQPGPYQEKLGKIGVVAALAVMGMFAVQIVTSVASDNAQVYVAQASISPYQKYQTLSTRSLTLPKDSNVFIRTSAPVQNDWIELDLSLVNEETNQEYEITQGIEYYYGYDGGESWSEGKQYEETFISRVPKGNYRLLIDADAGAYQSGSPADFSVEVKRDVPNWSNFWITLLLLMSYPFFVILRHWRFESKRWSESDYAPALYRRSEEEDE